MKGFFEDYSEKKVNSSNRNLSDDPCGECGLYKQCKSPKMNYTGEGRQKVLIVAEGSGKSEDEDWKKLGYDKPTQLIGQAGRLMRDHLKPYNLDLDRDFWKINSVNCRTPDNRKPSKKEIKCCRFMVDRAIEELKPEMIWLLGGAAVESFYQGIYSHLEINTWRKLCIPDIRSGAWIILLFHPSYLLRNEGNRNLESTFERDLKWAVSCIGKEKPEFIDFGKQVTTLYKAEEVLYALEVIRIKEDPMVFDYEATSLKPYGKGNKIWSIAANGYSFPFSYPHWTDIELREIREAWTEVLSDEKVLKVAHNLKFEDQWSRTIFDIPEVKGWHWCTMNAAHIIDARKYYTSLEFQGLINFGVLPYDQDVKKHIKPKNGSRFNTLDQVPLEKLLLYGGIDERITSVLWTKQEKFLSRKRELKKAYQFFHKGLLALSDAQGVGICIDKEYYLKEE
jgi:DNA polymerase